MNGLRASLFKWLLASSALLLLGGVAGDYYTAIEPANNAFDTALTNTATAISALVERENGKPVLQVTARTETALRTDRLDRIYFAVYRGNGELIGGDAALPFVGRCVDICYADVRLGDQPLRVVNVPYAFEGDQLFVQVAETRNKREQMTRRVTAATVAVNLVVLVVALTLIGLGIESGLKPVDELREAVARRPARDLTPLPTDGVPLELRPLIEALNRKLALLAESLSSQERFLSDAAHQLKTPLAALKSQLELAIGDADEASRGHRLTEMSAALDRVAHLAHQLLALARAEPSAGLQADRQPVRLDAIVGRLADSHLDRAIARDIDLGFEVAPAEIEGVPWLLRELAVNLVENALSYTPSGGRVTVHCGRRDGRAFLEVEDDGPGIPADERSRVFERFYRIRGSMGDGCGLGLAIVKEIAARHAATVDIAEGAGGKGARFTATFPA